MKSLIVILVAGYFSWSYIDLSSESALESVLSPLMFTASLIAFCLWLVIKGGVTGHTSDRTHYGGAGFFGDDGGSDGGGGYGGD